MVKDCLSVKALREVKSNLKQYISVILIACLAVTLFTGILANFRNFGSKVEKIYQESNMCDAIITTELVENDSSVSELENYLVKENIDYEKRLLMLGKSDNITINLVIFDENTKFNLPILTTNNEISEDDILVDENLLKRKELYLGDLINIKIEALGFDASLDFKITQTMTHPEALDNSQYSSSLVYVGKRALVDIIEKYIKDNYPILANIINRNLINDYLNNSYNQILIKDEEATKIVKHVKENFDVIFALERKDLPSNLTIEQDILQAKKLLYIFPVIFYAVALLIILTSITQLIHRESKNIGLLRALGYSKKEITSHYVFIFMIVSLIGGILGLVLGPLIIPFVMDQKYNILYQLPKMKMPFFRFEYLYSILILFIITILNTFIALNQTLKKLPAKSIRGENTYEMKDIILDKVKCLDGKLLNLKMALRNMRRSISRTLMVILGVMGCSALLLCGFGIEDTLNNSIDKELSLVDYDVNLSYKNQVSTKEELLKNEDVLEVTEYAIYEIQISKDSVINSSIYMIPSDSDMINYSLDENSCLISTKVAETINAKVGDEISYTYNNEVYKSVVTNILDASFSQGIFISTDSLVSTIKFNPTAAYVRAKDNVNNFDLADKLEQIDNIFNAMSIDELLVNIDNTLSSIRIMTNTVKIFAIMLAIVVLYNLALLNFNDRSRDIATLKVLGYSKKEIISSFVIEILILTIFGSFIGLFLGTPLMKAVLGINENPLLTYLYYVKPISFVLTILLTAVSSILMNILMSKNIKKVKMVESLKSVE